MDTDDGQLKDGLVTFQSRQELEVRGTLLHLSRYAASFEIYGPEPVVRISEALEDFRIYSRDEPVYAGRAIVQHAVNTGTATICSVVLDDYSFDARVSAVAGQNVPLGSGFDDFVRGWQKVCKVLPEFKVAVADIRTFLVDCRRWMEQVELGIRSSPKSDLAAQERGVIDELSPRLVTLLDDLFERFEIRAARLDDDQRPVHRSYIQRHLHPIVLCAPFAYRSYRKPLGYAGDYEVVNMMLRDPQEGSSLFAKMFNVWLLHQASAAAHRNRIEFLKRRLIEETAAAVRAGRTVRIFSLGCGPAREVQDFLAESELSNHAQFTLVDFNEETLQHAVQAVSQKRREFGRSTSFETARKSVQQLLKDMLRAGGLSRNKDYDFIYCAGLFDYLPDRTCRRLLELFYQSLAPGGLVLATNIAPFSPNRGSLELILDWHLIYRDARGVAALLPDGLPDDAMKIQSDSTGVNVFFEARKNHGV